MELRVRPKSDFLQRASWRELYLLTRYWRADMEFQKNELRFLRLLLSNYFLIDSEKDEVDMDEVTALDELLDKTQQWQRKINQKIDLHMAHLKSFSANTFTPEQEMFRNEHEELEDHFFRFSRAFKRVKNQAYDLMEGVIKAGELQSVCSH